MAVIRGKKYNHQPFELVQAVPPKKDYSVFCLATKLKCIFEYNKLQFNL